MNYLRLAIIAGAVAAVVALIGGYGHNRYVNGVSVTTARYETALTKQKNDAAALLASEKQKSADLEKKLNAALAEQNLKDTKNAETTSALTRKLADLGRLRDPRTPSGGGCSSASPTNPGTPGSGGSNASEASGLLSIETSNDLRALLREADEVNNAYISCRADALNLRAQWPKQ